ncbi:MAG: DUF5906 domain-containing protein, partial [Ghiorsea sp.]
KQCSQCHADHGKQNTGITVAMKAVLQVQGSRWMIPEFTARDGRKLTDYNDLHVEEGLGAVRAQVEQAIAVHFPNAGIKKAEAVSERKQGEAKTGGRGKLQSIITLDEACERFSLIYGLKDVLFDHEECCIVPKSCVMDILPDHAGREWKTRSDRKVVRTTEVGFDPAGLDPHVTCNYYDGWPTVSSSEGSCEKQLALLEYLCSACGDDSRKVYEWVLKWLAYPIQNPGTKMKTALAFHGEEGTGKNLFFDSVKAIYGHYGFIIGQDALEDSFTDWMSAKLFLIANEVVARQELFHTKNKIKSLVTDDEIRIRAPYVKSMWERNHANMVFLSNELQPLVLGGSDRRFLVVWTPKSKDAAYYKAIGKEIAQGGRAALHHYLLHLDLGDFEPDTKPIKTEAKSELIALSRESQDRFFDEWEAGETKWLFQPCGSGDLFSCYREWCSEEGERYVLAQNRFSLHLAKRDGVKVCRGKVRTDGGVKTARLVVVGGRPDYYSTDVDWFTAMVGRFTREMKRLSEIK